MLHISNIRHSKLGCLQKHIPSKTKKKDFVGYGSLHVHISPLLVTVRESNGDISFNAFLMF